MDRRIFIKSSVLGSLTGVAANGLISTASAAEAGMDRFAGSVYYTKDKPGRWSAKVGGHLPSIAVKGEGAERKAVLLTAHEMKAYEHYIVKHILMDKDMKILGEKLFDPTKDKAASSEFYIGDYSGVLYAISMCNKHDTWLNSVSV